MIVILWGKYISWKTSDSDAMKISLAYVLSFSLIRSPALFAAPTSPFLVLSEPPKNGCNVLR